MGHGERLPGAGDAEQCLVAVAARQAGRQLGDRLRLVTSRREWRNEVERHYGCGAASCRATSVTPFTLRMAFITLFR